MYSDYCSSIHCWLLIHLNIIRLSSLITGYFTTDYHFYILGANERRNEPNDSTALWKDLVEGEITSLIQGFHYLEFIFQWSILFYWYGLRQKIKYVLQTMVLINENLFQELYCSFGFLTSDTLSNLLIKCCLFN